MKCQIALTHLDELRTDELAASIREDVHRHLEECDYCRNVGEQIDAMAAQAKELRCCEGPSCLDAVRERLFHRLDLLEPDSSAAGPSGLSYWIAFSAKGITAITPAGSRRELEDSYYRRFGRELEDGALPERFRRHVLQALAGEAPSRPAVDLSALDGLERRVLEELVQLPRGQVRPYVWLARQAGNPRAARAVGRVCALNPVPFLVPCHRIVPASGGIGNYAFGSHMKRELLEREGAPVDELERLGKAGIRFVASRTTGIFCFPTCPDARRIREENRLLLHDESEAKTAGLRPCRRCRPAAAA